MQQLLDCFPALGTAWWVEALLPSPSEAQTIKAALIAHLTQFEARYSRFRRDSLISTLNTTNELAAPDQALLDILRYGQALYRRTSGAFNFLVGNVLVSRGYGKGTVTESNDTLPNPDTDLVIKDDVITLHKGAVDFGGFGKGYVIDELATSLRHHGIEDFLINGGGDLYASASGGAPFTIHLEHPTEAGTYLGTTTLRNQGFAASSPYKRVWKQGDVSHTHIVGQTTRASFVKASRARDADAFATAALLLNNDTLADLAAKEHLSLAHYEPTTQDFTARNFDFTPA